MYDGTNTTYLTFSNPTSRPIRCTASESLYTPFGTWKTTEAVYNLSNPATGGQPTVTNGAYGLINNNNISGGGGGGAGGEIKGIFSPTIFYPVVPGTPYTVIVGDGGAGGVGGPDSELEGTQGGDSIFATITSRGGSGGRASRDLNLGPPPTYTPNYIQNGYSNGGGGRSSNDNLLGGYGGTGAGGAGSGGTPTVAGSAGAGSGVGPNFSGSYASGGASGLPNTVATGVTTPNIGKGGSGTACTLNSFASGIKGGSGVVIIKYYI
jgi:hypothetical protein